MIPIHSKRNQNSISGAAFVTLAIASPVETMTMHTRIKANERATRSRRLNVRAYRSNEKAVIAIPAISSSLIVCKPLIMKSSILAILKIYTLRLNKPSCKEQSGILVGVIMVYKSTKIEAQFLGKMNRRAVLWLHFKDESVAA